MKPCDIACERNLAFSQEDGITSHGDSEVVDFTLCNVFAVDCQGEAVAVDAIGCVEIAFDGGNQEIPVTSCPGWLAAGKSGTGFVTSELTACIVR